MSIEASYYVNWWLEASIESVLTVSKNRSYFMLDTNYYYYLLLDRIIKTQEKVL